MKCCLNISPELSEQKGCLKHSGEAVCTSQHYMGLPRAKPCQWSCGTQLDHLTGQCPPGRPAQLHSRARHKCKKWISVVQNFL